MQLDSLYPFGNQMKTSNISVELIDSCGSDLSVVNAARVSFYKASEWEGTKVVVLNTEETYTINQLADKDVKLINYLAKHKHLSPFNHSFLSFRIKAPIFVARQLVKHKFMPFNEISRRYVTDAPEFYVPQVWRMKAEHVKQGSSKIGMQIDAAYRDKHGTRLDQSICNRKLTNWRNRAKREGKVFEIEYDDVPWVTHCPLLGMELNYEITGHAAGQDNSPSLDRIDNSKEYVKGNVQVLSRLANTMKSSATPEQLRNFAKAIAPRYGLLFKGASSIEEYYEEQVDMYNRLIKSNMCPEQARMFLPQSLMTEWIWSGTLGAYCDMLRLRLKEDTQEETRMVARLIAADVSSCFPVSYHALLGETNA